MSAFAPFAAIVAAAFWAGAAILTHAPARLLGAFELTRIQLVSSSAVLVLIVSATGKWATVSWQFWPSFLASSVFGVLVGNLCMVACLRRAGPRRTQLFMPLSPPISAALGFLVLGEALPSSKLAGAAVTLCGIWLAIRYGREPDSEPASRPGQLAVMVLLGLGAATCQAVGLILLKPALLAGTDPLAASALRTAGAAVATVLVALWPAKMFRAASRPTASVLLAAIFPGMMGYVVAVSLLLFAIRNYETGIALLLASTAPVLMLPMLWVTNGRRPPAVAWLGALAVVCGTGLIVAA